MRRTLPVKLSKVEIDLKVRELALAHHEYRDVEAEKKKRTRDLTARLKDLRAAQDRLSEEIVNEQEDRLVDCDETADLEARLWQTSRRDTGEIIETRPMTADEVNEQRQMAFKGH